LKNYNNMARSARNKSYLFFHSLVLILLVLMSAVYVWQMNHQAQNSFAIKNLEDKKEEIFDSIRERELEYSSALSLASVASRAAGLNLSSPSEVTFLEVGLNSVAVGYDSEKN